MPILTCRIDNQTSEDLSEFSKKHAMSRSAATEFLIKQSIKDFNNSDQIIEVEAGLKEEILLLKNCLKEVHKSNLMALVFMMDVVNETNQKKFAKAEEVAIKSMNRIFGEYLKKEDK